MTGRAGEDTLPEPLRSLSQSGGNRAFSDGFRRRYDFTGNLTRRLDDLRRPQAASAATAAPGPAAGRHHDVASACENLTSESS